MFPTKYARDAGKTWDARQKGRPSLLRDIIRYRRVTVQLNKTPTSSLVATLHLFYAFLVPPL